MAERNLRPEQLDVVEVNNVVKGVVPTVPVSKSTPRNVALTIDWISALVNHRVPCNEVSSAADIVAQLKYSTKIISVLESSTIWANSPFGRIFIAIDFCVNVARNISVVNAISSNGETCCGIVNHIF